jgi:2-polyprenyl-3-methyl-5-hydroxy-6-metoxy-1,4-benzoquinol methylase
LTAAAGVAAESGRALEEVPCNLCGGSETTPFTRRGGMRIVRCVACGLVYVNPRSRVADLDAHYNSGASSRVEYYLDAEAADRRTFAGILELCARLAPARGSLLDVGPCTGTFLVQAREAGFEAHGIEINAGAAQHCRDRLGLDVRAGVLTTAAYPEASFDLVAMGDVIEHLPDPLATLSAVARVLKPGGHVVVSTPNIQSAAARLLQVKPEEHIYYFSAATLGQALRKAGLLPVEMTTLDRYRNFTAMTHSTTCGSLFQTLAPLFRLARRLAGDVVLRLPLRENLLAVGRKP